MTILKSVLIVCMALSLRMETLNIINTKMSIMSKRYFPDPLQSQLTLTSLSEEETILEEIVYGNMEAVATIVQAEAGNQDLDGMRLVADVVLNRMDSPKFPNEVWDVIYQDGQFGPTVDGALEKAGWYICEDVWKEVEMEWDRESRLNSGILYFNTTWDNGSNPFKHGDHWFSY